MKKLLFGLASMAPAGAANTDSVGAPMPTRVTAGSSNGSSNAVSITGLDYSHPDPMGRFLLLVLPLSRRRSKWKKPTAFAALVLLVRGSL
jgi:hypothetical protein